MSPNFFEAFCEQQSPSAAAEWHDLKSRLFLDEGSSSVRVEAYRLQENQPWSGTNLNPNQQLTATRGRSSHNRSSTTGSQETTSLAGAGELPLMILRTQQEITAFADEPSQSQVFFIRQRNSYSPLSLSSDLYQSLVSTRRVSPLFRTFIQYLGERDSEVEIIPSAPKLRLVDARHNGKAQSTFESMCGIRFVEPHGRTDKSHLTTRWSFRQSAVYCRVGTGIDLPTCIFVTPSKALQQRLNSYLPKCGTLNLASGFEIQAMILGSAITNWRPYIVDLTIDTDAHASQVLGASPDNLGPMSMSNAAERQSLMILDEKVQNSLSAVKHTEELLGAILRTYETACGKWPDLSDNDIAAVYAGMSDELHVLVLRLQALQTRLQGVTNLVSSFLELSSGFALQQLARESRRENEEMRQLSERMHDLTRKATQDAAAVKVLTILTLIYLPATVVSNFFSTSFVSTNGNQNIVVLGDWWIFLASSVPLTLLTLYIWWVWMRIQAYRIYPWWWLRRRKVVGSES